MRIGLATCANLPSWEIDDRFLHAALREREVELEQPAWTDPGVDWSRFDAVLVRTTWDYQEQCDAYLAWAERVAACTRLLNPLAVLRWNTHKRYLAELEQLGVRLAPSVWLPGGVRANVASLAAEHAIVRGFFKPQLAANARGTFRFRADDHEQLAAAQRHLDHMLLERHEDMLLQPYLDGVESEGELSAIFFDGRFSHGVRKIPVPGDYRVQDDWGATDEPYELDRAGQELCRGVLAALDRVLERLGVERPLLYARIDLLRDHGGELVLNELELVEPSLFLRHRPEAGAVLADALLARLS